MNDICDRLGIDTMCGGNAAALAIEASQRGLIDEKLDFGDADGVAEFLEHMCRRDTPTGDLFAEGVAAVERAIPELKGIAVHVKGMAPAGYDPRCLKGMGLGYVTTSRGACHLRATFYKPELAGLIDPQIVDGKAEMFVDWEDRLCIMDTLIYCRFYRDLVQWPFITGVVNAAIGTDYTRDRPARARQSHRQRDARVQRAARVHGGRRTRSCRTWITERATDDEKALTVTAGRDGLHADRVLPAARLGSARALSADGAYARGAPRRLPRRPSSQVRAAGQRRRPSNARSASRSASGGWPR